MEHIRNKSYLGKKGYTIPKNILPPNELEFIKTEYKIRDRKQRRTIPNDTYENKHKKSIQRFKKNK